MNRLKKKKRIFLGFIRKSGEDTKQTAASKIGETDRRMQGAGLPEQRLRSRQESPPEPKPGKPML